MNKNTEEQTKHKFENNLCIPCRDLGKVHVKRKKKFDSARFKKAAYALREEQSIDLRKQIEEICDEYFGLSPSNVWDKRVRESASLEILQLITDREKEMLERGRAEGFAEYTKMELRKYNREKKREQRQKLAQLQGQENEKTKL